MREQVFQNQPKLGLENSFGPSCAPDEKKEQGYVNQDLVVLYVHYLLTPWCRVLHEKLTGLQLVKKFPAFHGTQRFITALTSIRHLSLSWASSIQSIYPHPTSWRSILILSTHLRLGLPSGLFPSGYLYFYIIKSLSFFSGMPRLRTYRNAWFQAGDAV